jgi:hypothetical protein
MVQLTAYMRYGRPIFWDSPCAQLSSPLQNQLAVDCDARSITHALERSGFRMEQHASWEQEDSEYLQHKPSYRDENTHLPSDFALSTETPKHSQQHVFSSSESTQGTSDTRGRTDSGGELLARILPVERAFGVESKKSESHGSSSVWVCAGLRKRYRGAQDCT